MKMERKVKNGNIFGKIYQNIRKNGTDCKIFIPLLSSQFLPLKNVYNKYYPYLILYQQPKHPLPTCNLHGIPPKK